MQGMAQTTYHVFLRRDGSYGVALSQFDAMVRTGPGFATEADARAWVARDGTLDCANTACREHHPVMPRAH